MKIVSLSILKYLEEQGLGKIDESLFWEKLGLDKTGLYITDLGGNQEKGARITSSVSIYSRGKSDLSGYKQLQKVIDLLRTNPTVCSLPAVAPYSNEPVENVYFLPPSVIASVGEDSNGRVIYSITVNLRHDA